VTENIQYTITIPKHPAILHITHATLLPSINKHADKDADTHTDTDTHHPSILLIASTSTSTTATAAESEASANTTNDTVHDTDTDNDNAVVLGRLCSDQSQLSLNLQFSNSNAITLLLHNENADADADDDTNTMHDIDSDVNNWISVAISGYIESNDGTGRLVNVEVTEQALFIDSIMEDQDVDDDEMQAVNIAVDNKITDKEISNKSSKRKEHDTTVSNNDNKKSKKHGHTHPPTSAAADLQLPMGNGNDSGAEADESDSSMDSSTTLQLNQIVKNVKDAKQKQQQQHQDAKKIVKKKKKSDRETISPTSASPVLSSKASTPSQAKASVGKHSVGRFDPHEIELPPVTPKQAKVKEQKKGAAEKIMKLSNGLQYREEIIGNGKDVQKGNQVSIRYKGTLLNGTVFDSNLPRGQPLSFTVGAGEMIKGFDQGVVGMKEGGRRVIVVPANLGYGKQSMDKIPANSTLIFEIHCLKTK